MRPNGLYGSALIASSLLLLAMALTHPAAVPLMASRQAFEEFTLVNHVAHGLAIGGVWLSVVGLAGFSRMLGTTRPSVTAAFIAFAMCAAAILVGAALDGFVVPQLAERWFDADKATRETLRQLMHFCVSVASVLTRIYMTLGSAAILLWSYAVWRARQSRGLPWLGVLVSITAVADDHRREANRERARTAGSRDRMDCVDGLGRDRNVRHAGFMCCRFGIARDQSVAGTTIAAF
jgi:hypothetical protein